MALNICSANSKEFSLDWIGDEIAALQNKLARENQKLGFCHNDLQYGNIMMDDETQSITIIVRFCYIYTENTFYVIFL